MSRLPDGTNPYGRLIEVMRSASGGAQSGSILIGEYLGGGKFSVGAQTLDEGDYLLIQNSIKIDGHAFKLPGLSAQSHDIEIHTREGVKKIPVVVPALEKGDTVIAQQVDGGIYIIFGKAVE